MGSPTNLIDRGSTGRIVVAERTLGQLEGNQEDDLLATDLRPGERESDRGRREDGGREGSNTCFITKV